MRKIVLLLYILTTSQTFAAKIKEVNGIPLPKGVVAKYDDLEDSFDIERKGKSLEYLTWLIYSFNRNLDLRIRVFPNKVILFAETRFYSSGPAYMSGVTIYIQNPGKEKAVYSFLWSNPSVFVDKTYNYYSYDTSEELTDFLDKNIQTDSVIDLVFTGRTSKLRRTLKKKHIKELNKMMEFYRRLK